jgi:hypothetical protein
LVDQSKPVRLRRTVTAAPRAGYKFPVEKRIEAVTKYLAVGNMEIVSQLTGVSPSMLRSWQKQAWWKDVEEEVKFTRRVQTNNKLSKIVDQALEAVGDRLEHGDFVYNAVEGTIDRRPVQLRDALRAANDLMQRQEALEKADKGDTTNEVAKTVKEQLSFLANEFAKFNTKRTLTQTTPEIEDAIYEEREEGLQEGSSPVYEQTGSSEEEDGTERGEGSSS